MRFSKVRPWLVGVVVMLLLASIPVSATAAEVGAQANWAPWASLRAIAEMPPIFVLGSEKEWSYPDIDGKYAVYQKRAVDADGTGPGSAPGDWNIYFKNLNTNVETAVTTAAGDQQQPRISGDWVVYTDMSGATDEVKAFRISSLTTKTITDRAGDQNAPDISGSLIVYQDTGTVRLYNLSTSVDSAFANPGDLPAISGARVVYREGSSIKINDMVEENVITLASDGGIEAWPRIDGDHVVYIDGNDIVAYTISTAVSHTIAAPANTTSYYPDVSGTIAIWRNHNSVDNRRYLEAYDFSRDEAVVLAEADPAHLTVPMISGNRFVCVAGSGTVNGDILLGTIKAPVISLSAASVVNFGSKPVLSGKLTESGDPLGAKSLDVLKSTNGGFTWTKIGTTTTKDDGSFGYTLPAQSALARYRARFNGETEGFGMATSLSRFSALSNTRAINVKVSLSKPSGRKSISNTKSYTYYGYLKPRYTAGTQRVWIKCYRKSSGSYKLKKTYTANLSDYSTYTKYSKKIKLGTEGKWRIRAYFKATSTNAETVSSWKYITVY